MTLPVVAKMAERFEMAPAEFERTVRATVCPSNITNEQFVAFLMVAKEYNLNPITKQIYAFPSKGGIVPIVSIDGWLRIINENPQFDGMEFVDNVVDGKLISITCLMYRKDRSRHVEVTEYMAECARGTDTWKQWPARMLRHKAYIQCARMAFGISEVIDDDEASRITANSQSGSREKDITPATKAIDWEAIKADMAECGDEESLNAVCVELRRRLEADGQWAQAKATCILMKSEHQARIQSYAAQADAVQVEALEGELEPAYDSDQAEPVEMEFE